MTAVLQALFFLVVLDSGMMDPVSVHPGHKNPIPSLSSQKYPFASDSNLKEGALPLHASNTEDMIASHTIKEGESKWPLIDQSPNDISSSKADTPEHNANFVKAISESNLSDNNSTVSKLDIVNVSRRADPDVAFSAQLSNHTWISSGSVILFNDVLVNVGEMYFGTSGQFVCPDDGAYLLVWSIKMSAYSSSRCFTSLVMAGVDIKQGPKTSWYESVYTSGVSQTAAVVQCRSSPLTAITVVSQASPEARYLAEESTSFSGFRLSPKDSPIGFTAELSLDIYASSGMRIPFKRVVTNSGGYYDGEHGFFECPDNGIYVFIVSLHLPQSSLNAWSVSKLVFDGDAIFIGPMTYRTTSSNDTGVSSATVLLKCQSGKDVYVEAHETYNFPFNIYGADLTSFTGARLCSNCDDFVAFSAVLTSNATTNNVNIVLNKVLLNHGNAYSPTTGAFTCPDDSLYMITYGGTSNIGYCHLHLYYNDSRIKRNYFNAQSSSESTGTSGTSSQSTIVRCSSGATVSLRGESLSSSRYLLADHTTFSGYRIPDQ